MGEPKISKFDDAGRKQAIPRKSFKIEFVKVQDAEKKIPYELSEDDLKKSAFEKISRLHTHTVSYRGRNNVSYSKICTPKKGDITLSAFKPVYLPFWNSQLDVLETKYLQEFYNNNDLIFYLADELSVCQICDKRMNEDQRSSLCLECAKVVCGRHMKIDDWDKKTPVCTVHARPVKLLLQSKYFASRKTEKEYSDWYSELGHFGKLREDKAALGTVVAILFIALILYLVFSRR